MAALKNKKHEAVAVAYVADPDRIGAKAYLSVYSKSSPDAAKTGFSRLLTNADFKRRIAELVEPAAEKAGVTVERILAELALIGFANTIDYLDVNETDGEPVVDLRKVSRDQAAAIAEVSVTTTLSGSGDNERETKTTKFKLADKRAALVDMGRHLGMFKDVKVLQDPDGRGAGSAAAEAAAEAEQISDLELGRRIAFALEQAARAPKPAAPADAPSKSKKTKSRKRAAATSE